METATNPVHTAAELDAELRRLRQGAARAAADCGARLLAVALPPTTPHEFPVTDTPRYRQIADRYGMLAHEQGICGCHVHVEVPDEHIAVGVCTRLRPWLPHLLALSANSAVYRSSDSGYASWRYLLWGRWPTAGPPPHLESVAEYRETLRQLHDAGAMLDDGMVYWDARPSTKFPTVEVRVADVPATVDETVLLATVARALVMTATADIRANRPVQRVPEPALRGRYWRAARDGVTAFDRQPLIDAITPALRELGEFDYVVDEFARVVAHGNGAVRQRRALQQRGEVADVLAEATAATLK